MRRLTKQQDELLQRLVRTDLTVREIAVEVGISGGTVTNIRRACMAVDSMPAFTRERIRRLLLVKTPSPQIAAMLGISVMSVCSLRRLDRFRDPPTGVSECGECGAKIFTPMKDQSHTIKNVEDYGYEFSRASFVDLLRVVRDLIELSDLHLITHPLFHHLSQRARKAYEENYEKKAETDSHSTSERVIVTQDSKQEMD